jgi:hypothetical protein
MANGYASNIPRENVPEAPPLLPEDVCMICKKRAAAEASGMCGVCAKALGA